MGVALQGWNGGDWAKGIQHREMRAIFPMYDSACQLAASKRAGIKSLNDLAGLRIGAGPRAGTAGTYWPEIFKVFGVAADFRFGPFEPMAAQVASGELDALASCGGVPFPVIAEIEVSQPVDFIELSAEQIAVIGKQMPEFTQSLVPAGTYRSLARDHRTIGVYNFAIAHKDLPDDLVYGIVKAVFDNRDELLKAHSAAKETVPANVGRNTFLPLHPGAVRYYREIGVPLSENVVPTN
jgi:TRAP transporter TAXI family solute receptor